LFAAPNTTTTPPPGPQQPEIPRNIYGAPERTGDFLTDLTTNVGEDIKGVQEYISEAYDDIKEMTLADVTKYLRENGELPGGVGGAASGALLGFFMAGPPGALVGAFIGGAGGSGAGSLYSSTLEEGRGLNELSTDAYLEAATEVALSMGIDIATLGLGRFAKPYLKTLITDGLSPEEFIKKLARGEAADVGTRQSAIQTQAQLNTVGASLTPNQAGLSDTLGKLTESFARMGLGSGLQFKRVIEKAKGLAQQSFKDILDTLPSGEFTASGKEYLGAELAGLLKTARGSIGGMLDERVTKIISGLSRDSISFAGVNKRMDHWLARPSNINALGEIDPKLTELVGPLIKKIQDQTTSGSGPLEHLFRLEKDIGDILSPAFDAATKGSPAYRTLTRMQKDFKDIVRGEIAKRNPKAAAAYKAAKKDYAKSIKTLFPQINANQINVYDPSKFQAIGNLATKSGTPEQMKAMMNSIDKGYAILKSTPEGRKTLAGMPIKTAEAAKMQIKRGYLAELLTNSKGGVSAVKDADWRSLAVNLTNSNTMDQTKAIFGAVEASKFKKVVNMLAEVTQKPESQLLGLAQRSAEISSLRKLSSITGKAVGVVTSIFGAPMVMARILLNPNRTNRLLIAAGKQRKKPTKDYITEALMLMGNDIAVKMASEWLSDDEGDLIGGS
jgi:hypothetical protein